MRINLNQPNNFSIDNLKLLMKSEDDTVHTQFRVTKDGYLFLSKDVGNKNLENILFRLETNIMGNGYVGHEAIENSDWVKRIYKAINDNWPNPTSTYIDTF